MPETLTSSPSAPGRSIRMNGAGRSLQRRRTLPGGRAVVGGFLVAASVVGVVAVSSAADEGPASAYVVLARDVDAGARLRAGDLRVVPVELPAAQRAVSFDDPSVLVGATALGALAEGQLVQSSDVARPPGDGGLASLSLPVEPARALNGDLQRGDRVDVLVTYTESGEPSTSTVAADALVVDVLDASGGALGSTGSLSVSLAVPRTEVEAVAQAGAAGTVTLVRTTGLPAEPAPRRRRS